MTLPPPPLPSGQDLALMGIEKMAYVRPAVVNGRHVQIIHAADGTFLTLVMNRDLAFMTIRQNEMLPVSVH